MCLTCLIALGVDSVSWEGDWRRHLTQGGDRDDDRPRVFAGYGYLSGDSTPLLVAKDRRTGMTFAAALSMKGSGDPARRGYASEMDRWIEMPGRHRQNRSSIRELIRRVRELRAEGTTTVDEVSHC